MTKRELIDEIMDINHTAEPDFLAEFADNELDEYLRHLQEAQLPRPVRYSRQSNTAVETPAPHNACNTAMAEFPPSHAVVDSTNPFGSVTVTVADFSAREQRVKIPNDQMGFRNPSQNSVCPPSQPKNDNQAWLF